MRFSVTLDRDEDGIWIVECPSISIYAMHLHKRSIAIVYQQIALAAANGDDNSWYRRYRTD